MKSQSQFLGFHEKSCEKYLVEKSRENTTVLCKGLPEIALALATAARTGREASRGGVEELESGKSPSSREFCLIILTINFLGSALADFLPAARRIFGRIISAGSLPESTSSSSEYDFLEFSFRLRLLTSFSTEDARELSIEG